MTVPPPPLGFPALLVTLRVTTLDDELLEADVPPNDLDNEM